MSLTKLAQKYKNHSIYLAQLKFSQSLLKMMNKDSLSTIYPIPNGKEYRKMSLENKESSLKYWLDSVLSQKDSDYHGRRWIIETAHGRLNQSLTYF